MKYKHTQIGYEVIIALILPLLILAFVLSINSLILVLSITVISLILFYSLTVEINKTNLVIKFGIGIINKKFNLKDIKSCSIVRNPWYYGWGIHLTSNGWLFNISGLSAIEIQMKNGKKYRIGTDEEERLKELLTKYAIVCYNKKELIIK